MSDVVYIRECPRCFSVNNYVSVHFFKLEEKDPHVCKVCRPIPDKTLKRFVELQQYIRLCPQCNKLIVHKRRESYRAAMRDKSICKACGHIPINKEKEARKRLEWEAIAGYWPVKFRTFNLIRKWWAKLTAEERVEFMKKNSNAEILFLGAHSPLRTSRRIPQDP